MTELKNRETQKGGRWSRMKRKRELERGWSKGRTFGEFHQLCWLCESCKCCESKHKPECFSICMLRMYKAPVLIHPLRFLVSKPAAGYCILPGYWWCLCRFSQNSGHFSFLLPSCLREGCSLCAIIILVSLDILKSGEESAPEFNLFPVTTITEPSFTWFPLSHAFSPSPHFCFPVCHPSACHC